MTQAKALQCETALRAWLRTLPSGQRASALEAAAAEHGHATRAAEAARASTNRGTWYTPQPLVEAVLDHALSPAALRTGRVLDPACGSGHFLVAAGQRMVAAGRPSRGVAAALRGVDIDPKAVALTRLRLQHAFGGAPAAWRAAITCADALRLTAGDLGGPQQGGFAAVVGNPPFLSQLRTATAASRAQAAALRERFGGAVAGYADLATAFLLLACEAAAPGGTVALVLPLALLSTADAAAVRQRVASVADLRACLLPPVRVFGGGVGTMVLVAQRRRSARAQQGRASVRVQGVLGHQPAQPVLVPAQLVAGGAWAPLVAAARGVPAVALRSKGGTLAQMASATADFRQHFYGLKGRVAEAGARKAARAPAAERAPVATRAPAAGLAPVATVGAVDAAHLAWGERAVRLHGAPYLRPVVNVRALRAADPAMGRWATARLVPKVLLATQTRALEAWVDAGGQVLPCTPLISVVPRKQGDVWLVAAVMLAPPVCAAAWWRHAGAALSVQAIKLRAKDVLELPLPAGRAAWRRGAAQLQKWQQANAAGNTAAAHAARSRFAAAMCAAYGVAGNQAAHLTAWWLAQLQPVRPRRSSPAGKRSARTPGADVFC